MAGRRRPFPEWVDYRPSQIWVSDATHFTRAGMAVTVGLGPGITQVAGPPRLVRGDLHPDRDRAHRRAGRRGLLDGGEAPADGLAPIDVDDEAKPILLAVSDNVSDNPQMTLGSTREFMALCAIVQHFGRPGTPPDRPSMDRVAIRPPQSRVASTCSRPPTPACCAPSSTSVERTTTPSGFLRGIGYVTGDDEHEGRGKAIRKACEAGP